MTTPFFLIDFENVQPKALDRLKPGGARIKVFLGEQQSKLMLEVVQALQPFGPDAEYIQIQGSGPDAVDFHIAYFIGRLAAGEPDVAFNIISKDKGFDPLVRYLNGKGISCRRLPEIPGTMEANPTPTAAKKAAKATVKAAVKAGAKKATSKVTVTVLPPAKPAAPAKVTTTRARVGVVITLLKKSTKPGTLAGLRSSIKSWLKPEVLDDKTVDAIVQSLRDSKKITVAGTKVSYALG